MGKDAAEPSLSESETLKQREDFSLSWRSVVFLCVFGVTILGANLGGARVLTHHETLFAQPAREMIQSGDWVIPTMCGVPSCHKPPVTYWVLGAFMSVFGTGAEWAVRLPILLATLAAGLLIAWMTARWHGERAGLWAGVVQLSSFYVLMQGRLAESDMLFCLAICCAMAAFAAAAIESPSGRLAGRWLPWLFYLFVGIAFLVKGPLGVALIGGGAGLFILWQRSGAGLRFLLSPTGWSIAAIVGLSWPLLAYWQFPGILDDWRMHNLDRFSGGMGGAKPPFFYFYMAPLLVLPWTPFVVDGLRRGWNDAAHRTIWRLLAAWFLAGFALLSLSVWKHKHYLIPLLPPLSVFAGASLARFQLAAANCSIKQHAWKAIAVLPLAVGLAYGIVWTTEPVLAPPALVLSAVVAVGLAAAVLLESRGARRHVPVALTGAVWAAAIGVHYLMMPHFDSYRDHALFAAKINASVQNGSPVHVVALPENQIVYYLDGKLVRQDDPETFLRLARTAEAELTVLGPKSLGEMLKPIAEVQVTAQSPTIRKIMTEAERLTLFRVRPTVLAEGDRRSVR